MNCEHDWVVIERSTERVTGRLKSLFAERRVCLKCHEIDDQIEACRRRDEERAAWMSQEREAEAKRVALEKEKEQLRIEQATAIYNGFQAAKAANQAAKGE